MDNDNGSAKEDEINIFIVENHRPMRKALGKLIQRAPGLALCGEASSAGDALEKLPDCQPKPDVILVDNILDKMNAIELVPLLRQVSPEMRILVLSMEEERFSALPVLDAGAHGYLMKTDYTKLIEAIHRVYNGGLYVSKKIRSLLGIPEQQNI